MAVSSNVIDQQRVHPFESLEIEIDPNFDPFDAMEGGTKNQDGSVTLKQVDPLEEDKKEPADKKDTIVTTEDDSAIDDFLDKALGGKKEEDGEQEGNKDKIATSGDTNPIQTYYDLMVKSGLWNETEGFDGTEEALEKARNENHQAAIEEDVNAFIDEAFEKNPDGKVYGKALLNHLAKGGKISDFVQVYSQDEIVVDNLDNEDKVVAEETASAMLREYYSDKMKPAQLVTLIANKKKAGLLIDAAKDIAEPFSEIREENKKALSTNTDQARAKQKENAKKYQTSILSITEKEKVGNITIGKTPQERKELAGYMLQPTVELQDGRKIPQLYADLEEAKKDPEWNVVLAKTLRDWKNKKPATEQTDTTKKSSIKETITEILEKNKTNLQSASSEITEQPKRTSVKGAWADFV